MSAAEKEIPSIEETLARLTALVAAGDRWLSADAAAEYMGQMPRKTFLEHAAKADFPAPTRIGKRRVWQRSDIDAWMKKLRAKQLREPAA